MSELAKNTIGYIGGALLIITLFPQIHQTYKTKKTRDISLLFMFLEIITCIFFFTYGIIIEENPIIMANSVVLIELFLLLYAKLYFKEPIENIINIKNIKNTTKISII